MVAEGGRRRPPWEIVPLTRAHRRDRFDCGVDALNEFLRKYARQNAEKGLGRTFVALRPGESVVRGYYTLSSGAIAFETLPPAARRRLPRYPVPVAHLGRLAVDREEQGKGLGETLLMDALRKVLDLADLIAIYAVEVVAEDAAAKQFYERYGLTSLVDDTLHMFVSLQAVNRAFRP